MTATGRTERHTEGVRVVVTRTVDAPLEDVWVVPTSRRSRAIGSWDVAPSTGEVAGEPLPTDVEPYLEHASAYAL